MPRRLSCSGLLVCSFLILSCRSESRVRSEDTASVDSAPGGHAATRLPAIVGYPPPGADTLSEESRVLEGNIVLNAVRVARNAEGKYDRIVFQFNGDRIPPHSAYFSDSTLQQCGSGAPLVLSGAATFVMRFQATDAHTFDGSEAHSTIGWRDKHFDLPIIRQVAMTCDFEGIVSWGIGLSRRGTYQVHELSAPPRLVIDFQY